MTALAGTQEHIANYAAAFGELEKAGGSRNPGWLKKLRAEGFARFCETGLPTARLEDWRFTDTSPIAQTEFRLPKPGAAVSERRLTPYRILTGEHHASRVCVEPPYHPETSLCRLVFVNGRFAASLSTPGSCEGVTAGSLAQQIADHPETVEPYLGHYLNIDRDAFCALNTAFLEDGGYVHVARHRVCEAPIHLLFVSTGADAPLMTHPRNLIIAEDGAEVSVVEEYVSLDESAALSNTATEAIAKDGAVLAHFMIERENTRSYNISTLRIEQGRDTNVASHSVLTGGALVRNNVHPVLHGEGGECLINGLFIGNGRQHLDNYMLVEHASAHCGSRQFYNGILDDRAHGVFHGRIVVHKDAQKTDAKQTNRNLLLSDDAQMDTKPQLEIFADDVKCTHGATIGQLDDNALFYLRSRGIDEPSARRLLLRAFASECLERVKQGAARDYVEALIQRHIGHLAVRGAGSEEARAATAPERSKSARSGDPGAAGAEVR